MSTGRNIPEDQAATAWLVSDPSARLGAVDIRPNWLGHTGGAADVDRELLDGAPFDELLRYRTTPDSLNRHLFHLRQVHGLAVERGPVLRFCQTHLGISGGGGHTPVTPAVSDGLPPHGPTAAGQGVVSDAAVRRAIETAAMNAATAHFEGLGYTVTDRSASEPYDLLCRRRGQVLYVEVKGTRSGGDEVVLTSNEVDFARGHRGEMGLFVLHSVEVVAGPGDPQAGGGVARVTVPWDVDEGVLRPASYRYRLPPDEGER